MTQFLKSEDSQSDILWKEHVSFGCHIVFDITNTCDIVGCTHVQSYGPDIINQGCSDR